MTFCGVIVVVGLGLGAIAAGAALYGRYRVLPAILTGPVVCRLEAGGCQVLFRTPTARLLGVPNAALGLLLYAGIAVGVARGWSPALLLAGASAALAMSVYLARYLVVNRLECRICWVGHVANAMLWSCLFIDFLR